MKIEINKSQIFAGPCSVESEEQILTIAEELSALGIKYLRGGAFKPRTSPKSFQGLGEQGLIFLRNAADRYNMSVVSELLDTNQLEKYIDMIDVVQIGSKNMMSYGFLKTVGKLTAKQKKKVLLKRGFQSTINEFLLAAEYIMNEGNPDVILCLRGIRTFEQIDSALRFTPDLAGILEIKEKMKDISLPVFFDPSHATGNARYVIEISKAAIMLGADGLLIECHPHPEKAVSDGEQSILPGKLIEILDFIQEFNNLTLH